jgi:hypothetical protein
LRAARNAQVAMAAGVTDHLRSMNDIVALVEARAAKPGRRGPYKKRPIGNSQPVFTQCN